MKIKRMTLAFALSVLALLAAAVPPAAGAAAEELPAWTVMFYLCGSDLESRHSFASQNLEDIVHCINYEGMLSIFGGETTPEAPGDAPQDVNVLVETGGCEVWHAGEIGMDIDPGALQRWQCRMGEVREFEATNTFELVDEQPLASMADARTLADFIRFCAETCPAKKYALVLWGHGGGSKTGVLIDELFGGDILRLDELRGALADGGVRFEAVLFDACLMANLETACAIKDSANWMIASEEVVAGRGTAMGGWLQQLYITPQWDGQRLGRWICDMTQQDYAEEADAQSQSALTWSVIDLSRIDDLAAAFDAYFEAIGDDYANDPAGMMGDASVMTSAFQFGLGDEGMIDLAEVFYDFSIGAKLQKGLYDSMLDALMEAVVYNTHGQGRAKAGGLSFCYAVGFAPDALEIYARNCPSAHYLALLDAINPDWTAPEWVYERAWPLTGIEGIPDYQILVEKQIEEDGMPCILIKEGFANIGAVHADLSHVNEATGYTVRLGSTLAGVDFKGNGGLTYALDEFWMWPAIEGVHCDAELVRRSMGNELYSIPLQLGTDTFMLRCGVDRLGEKN